MEEPMKTAMLLCILFLFGSGLMALTGYGTTAPVINDTVDPTLSITAPNGGEAWYIGDTRDITWNASDTNILSNSVNICYSLNGGTDYTNIIENTNNDGIHPWALPSVQSYNARVRIKVSDSFGNYSQKASASPFSITYVPPLPPDGVAVNTSNGLDAVITWQPVTQNIYNSPMTPDGYIVLYNETPYEDDQYYYFLGRSYTTAYTHHDVAEFRNQMFYKVLAYKNYRGDVDNVIQAALANPDAKISLAELKAALHSYNIGGEK
ncbi:MAG: hypothetical protein PHV91_09810 [Bacteroidales bacterium]|nr:hypothetical protein [Bacteroidales bacterium]